MEENDSLKRAREIAGQCWCDPETKMIEMDVRLAGAFAKRLAPYLDEIDRLRAEVKALKVDAEVEALRVDRDRMAWLAEEAEYTCGQWQVVIDCQKSPHPDDTLPDESFVEAIDAWRWRSVLREALQAAHEHKQALAVAASAIGKASKR